MKDEVKDIFYTYVKNYRDPYFFLLAGFLIGKGVWLLGVTVILLYILVVKNNKLLNHALIEYAGLKILYSVNVMLGILIGYWHMWLIGEYVGVVLLASIIVFYVNMKFFKMIVAQYIENNLNSFETIK